MAEPEVSTLKNDARSFSAKCWLVKLLILGKCTPAERNYYINTRFKFGIYLIQPGSITACNQCLGYLEREREREKWIRDCNSQLPLCFSFILQAMQESQFLPPTARIYCSRVKYTFHQASHKEEPQTAPHQYSFTKLKSTVPNLVTYVNTVISFICIQG